MHNEYNALLMIKPDAIRNKVAGDIISMLEKNFYIKDIFFIKFNRSLAEEFYIEHLHKNFYKELVEQDSLNAKHNLFLGISYLANYQTKNAIKTLEKDFATDDFKDDRIWYLALAYIKNNQLDDAKPLLQTLATNDSYYSSNATSILDDITTSTAQKN